MYRRNLVRSCLRYVQTEPRPLNGLVDFGFRNVPIPEKEQLVSKVFSSIATRYDVLNDAMSLGLHRYWKDVFMQRLSPTAMTRLVDVAGGTGDIAFRFLDTVSALPVTRPLQPSVAASYHVTVVDLNADMIQVGEKRAKERGFTRDVMEWHVANAESLPMADESVDAYTIAFGLRNCTHRDKVLLEAKRVLRRGGRFMCLEFSRVEQPLLSQLYDIWSFQVIPLLGAQLAGDREAYQYLVESIRRFPSQEELKKEIQLAGFSAVSYENLTGGIVAIHSGYKL